MTAIYVPLVATHLTPMERNIVKCAKQESVLALELKVAAIVLLDLFVPLMVKRPALLVSIVTKKVSVSPVSQDISARGAQIVSFAPQERINPAAPNFLAQVVFLAHFSLTLVRPPVFRALRGISVRGHLLLP